MRVVSVKLKSDSHTYNSEEYYYKSTFPVIEGDEVIIDDNKLSNVLDEYARDLKRLSRIDN